jgi:hypothetical protein
MIFSFFGITENAARDSLMADRQRQELDRTSKEILRKDVGAWVAELVDARDLKSLKAKSLCGFDSRPRHHGK